MQSWFLTALNLNPYKMNYITSSTISINGEKYKWYSIQPPKSITKKILGTQIHPRTVVAVAAESLPSFTSRDAKEGDGIGFEDVMQLSEWFGLKNPWWSCWIHSCFRFITLAAATLRLYYLLQSFVTGLRLIG
ncbi:hypothetical protein A2U01_0006744 [Trifolium medium]|uniref:Uncharacterized protein n=1 Tax=Trifolium medium TaxID=97028 RepID=A0A392MEG3_9FABA|nr:hypothetical protein [Trifolium medium]